MRLYNFMAPLRVKERCLAQSRLLDTLKPWDLKFEVLESPTLEVWIVGCSKKAFD